jgi:hypothetical protein
MTVTYTGNIDTVALLIQVGDGGSPEVFTHPCLINAQRGIHGTAAVTKSEIPRCDDPTQPMKTVAITTSTDTSLSGDGIMDAATFKTYWDWFKGGQPKNIKIQLGSVVGALIVTGPFLLTDCSATGSKHGEMVTASLKFQQADDPVSSAHA